MTLESWKRIRELFDAVVDLPPSERSSVLTAECAGNDTLRRQVESLIGCDENSQLDRLVQRSVQSAAQVTDPAVIGNYRIRGRLGEGGMGVVYDAEQLHPPRRVALKIIRAGQLASERERRLFEREAEVLGRLEHSGIAGIFESGSTPDGQPYLVMEFVAGQTLSARILSEGPPSSFRKSDLASRVELFIQICEAITYAHQRGVIHRDLKPSNIMVTDGGVKVLDFGLARLADELENTRTETGVVQGSLRYMSPEQARGETGQIDVRSDIYSLGVVLYEMISGQHPYLDKTDLLSAVRQICEAPPKPLHAIRKPVSADLETILAKALAKEPAQRYESVAAFAGDLGRFLRNEPILARPASLGYQVRKLVERNRLAAVAAVLIAILVVAFAVVSFRQALRIRDERDRANQEAATARQVSDFLVNLFRETNPAQTNGVLSAKDLLLAGRNRLAVELKDKPELRARLLDNIGSAFNVVGPLEEAAKSFEESIQIRGADQLASAAAWTGLSDTYYNLGQYKQSVAASRRALDLKRRYLPADNPAIAAEMNALAMSLSASGDLSQSALIFAELIELDRKTGRGSSQAAGERLGGYGSVLRRLGRLDESIATLSAASKTLENSTSLGDRIKVWNDLGMALNAANRYGEGETWLSLAVEGAKRVFGATHPNVGVLQLNLTYSLIGQKKLASAAVKLSEVKLILEKTLPGTHPTWSDVWGAQAQIEAGNGRFAKAARDWDKALAISTAALGADHHRTMMTAQKRAENLAKVK